jgi:hypothetical protein
VKQSYRNCEYQAHGGKRYVSKICSRDRIDNASKDRAGWETTVDRMIGHGAQLDADERAAVIEYLSSN